MVQDHNLSGQPDALSLARQKVLRQMKLNTTWVEGCGSWVRNVFMGRNSNYAKVCLKDNRIRIHCYGLNSLSCGPYNIVGFANSISHYFLESTFMRKSPYRENDNLLIEYTAHLVAIIAPWNSTIRQREYRRSVRLQLQQSFSLINLPASLSFHTNHLRRKNSIRRESIFSHFHVVRALGSFTGTCLFRKCYLILPSRLYSLKVIKTDHNHLLKHFWWFAFAAPTRFAQDRQICLLYTRTLDCLRPLLRWSGMHMVSLKWH